MLRNLVILAVSALLSAAIPLAYRSSPTLFGTLPGNDPTPPPPSAESVAAKPQATANPDNPYGRKVRLEPDGRGHYVGEFRLNGARVPGLVDTGATLVAINRSTARRIGVRLQPSDFRHEVSTANGKTMAAAVTIDRIEIGRLIVRNVQAAVLDDRALATTLVGMSFLGRLRRFEAGGGALLLEQ